MSINETIQKHSSHPLAPYSSRPYPATTTALLPRRHVIYCGACGMPPEYCPFGPDFETHCDPWLAKHHAEFRTNLIAYLGSSTQTTTTTTTTLSSSSSSKINNNKGGDKHKASQGTNTKVEKTAKPDHPWTTMERLTAFYHKYAPDKIDGAATILDKYAGKEEQLFRALVQKYGPEAQDPYFSDSEDDDDDDDHVDDDEEEEDEQESNNDHDDNQGQEHVDAIGISKEEKKKRRGAGAKKLEDSSGGAGSGGTPMRVVIQKVAQKKKRNLTVVTGLETARHLKLKDVAKVLSKKFAGSSSVKDDNKVIVQGDHTLELAELLVDKFAIPETALWLDMGDGEVVPFR